jgi:hypothetical protein
MLLGVGNHVCGTLRLDREVRKEMKEQINVNPLTVVKAK